MKILLVSMPSLHFFRWTEQLKNSNHDVFWFDIVDGNPTEKLPWVCKINGWKLKHPNFKGRYFIKNRLPFLYKILKVYFERNVKKEFEKVLKEVQPDLVHSFAMQIACVPIINIMEKHYKLKWVYSSWGSDLYNLKSVKISDYQVTRVISRVDYFISDCLRDYEIVKNFNYKGNYLGCFPGGGGYDLKTLDKYIVTPVLKRNIILIKGYQGDLGRCIQVLLAIRNISLHLKTYEIVIFSADQEVVNFVKTLKNKTNLNISVLEKKRFLQQKKVMELMGKSLIYIGNSISDGIPNTLLEAIIMGAFPIQSNPGGASAEVVNHKKNGFLIENPENINAIENLILKVITNHELIKQAYMINQKDIKPKYERERIRSQVLKAYNRTND